MKVAVLSDVHGNVPALSAVLDDIQQWQADIVVVNGDLVNRGPYSLKVLQQVKAAHPGVVLLKGNHEAFVLYAASHPTPPTDTKYPLRRFAEWSARQLGEPVLAEIERWQDEHAIIDSNGINSLQITHGSRLGNRDGISLKTPDEALADKVGEPSELFVVSHTHKAMLRYFENTLIVNTGSVGQPLDEDARSSYGQFTFNNGKWQAEIRRIAYDKQQAERDFLESGFVSEGGPIAQLIFLEHRHNTMMVGPFMHTYHDAIVAGDIEAGAAVELFLKQNNITLNLDI